jgi:hypothetical protein
MDTAATERPAGRATSATSATSATTRAFRELATEARALAPGGASVDLATVRP